MSEEKAPDTWQTMIAKLAQPLDNIDFLPRAARDGKALALAYCDSRDVQARLDSVCGARWSFDFQLLSPDGKMVKGLLTVDGVTRCDAGEAAQEDEPLKSAVSDALKRCAVQFGVGRYLYYLPQVWAPFDPQKKRWIEKPVIEARAISKAVALAIGQTLGQPTPAFPAQAMATRQEAAANRAAEAKPQPPASAPKSEAPPPAAALACARDGCEKPITAGMVQTSKARGLSAGYCPACQKIQAQDAAPTTNGAKPAEAAAPAAPKDDLIRARESYMARFGERFGKVPDARRYALEAVLLAWDRPLEPLDKSEWDAENWQYLRSALDRCDLEDVKSAAEQFVNAHAPSLPLSAPVTTPAAPSGLSR